MTDTANLISALVADAPPVRRLRPPLVRAALWLGLAAVVFVLLGMLLGHAPDEAGNSGLAARIGLAASLLTGVLAAIAAVHVALPDRSPAWALLPLPSFVVWFAAVGYGCLTDWVGVGPGGLMWGMTAQCVAMAAVVGLPLGLAMLSMLRRARPLRPGLAAATAGLAVAALSATAHTLFHGADASVIVLILNLGPVALIAGLGVGLRSRTLA